MASDDSWEMLSLEDWQRSSKVSARVEELRAKELQPEGGEEEEKEEDPELEAEAEKQNKNQQDEPSQKKAKHTREMKAKKTKKVEKATKAKKTTRAKKKTKNVMEVPKAGTTVSSSASRKTVSRCARL